MPSDYNKILARRFVTTHRAASTENALLMDYDNTPLKEAALARGSP